MRYQAEKLLGKILDVKFVGTLLGGRDVYRVIATTSCQLQEVEQFPWQVTKTLRAVVDKLSSMSNNLHIDDEQVQGHVDLHDWHNLAYHLDDLKEGIFLNMAVESASERRQGRIRDYIRVGGISPFEQNV